MELLVTCCRRGYNLYYLLRLQQQSVIPRSAHSVFCLSDSLLPAHSQFLCSATILYLSFSFPLPAKLIPILIPTYSPRLAKIKKNTNDPKEIRTRDLSDKCEQQLLLHHMCVYVYIYNIKYIYYISPQTHLLPLHNAQQQISITEILELYFWMEVILFKKSFACNFFCLNNVLYLNSLFLHA